MSSSRDLGSGLRLIITLKRNDKKAGNEYYDITDNVIELGPLCESRNGLSGEPQAESVRLRLFGDGRYNPRNPGTVFGDYEKIHLDIYKDGAHVFFGAISYPPRLDENAENETTTLHFVGGLKGLWPSLVDDFVNSDIEYADPERDLWPLLLKAADFPISRSLVSLAPIDTDEDVWSTVGRPNIEFMEYSSEDTAKWGVVSPAECSQRNLVYAGFGPFLLSYSPDSGKWETVAVVPDEWRIYHLEYDGVTDEIYGVAARAEDDITRQAAHNRARFVLAL